MSEQLDLLAQLNMTPEMRRVATVLKRHKGQSNAICRRDLCAATGLSDRAMRDAVASLVTDHDWPIIAGHGYYLTDDAQLLIRAADTLDNYIRELSRRKTALHRIAQRLSQRGLFVDLVV